MSGAVAQYESEVVYHNMKERIAKARHYLYRYRHGKPRISGFGKNTLRTVISNAEHKFSALNSAVWRVGPLSMCQKCSNVRCRFRHTFVSNGENAGQFERSLIIVEEGGSIQYIEGCTAPTYTTNSLHAANVEIIVKKDASSAIQRFKISGQCL